MDSIRIVLTGSHGVGKTTLAANLLAELGAERAIVVPETARQLAAEGFAVNDRMTLEGFLRYIQLYLENIRQACGEFIISDRSLVDLYVYTKESPVIPDAARQLLLELIQYEFRFIDRYVIVPIEFALDPDGVRPTDVVYQRKIEDAVRRFLSDSSAPILEVFGSLDARTRHVTECLEHSA